MLETASGHSLSEGAVVPQDRRCIKFYNNEEQYKQYNTLIKVNQSLIILLFAILSSPTDSFNNMINLCQWLTVGY